MRASEAKVRLCPFTLARSYAVNGGPAKCQTDMCMAWRVYQTAGTRLWHYDKRPVPDGWQIVPVDAEEAEQPPKGHSLKEAVEDLGECHALPVRPE